MSGDNRSRPAWGMTLLRCRGLRGRGRHARARDPPSHVIAKRWPLPGPPGTLTAPPQPGSSCRGPDLPRACRESARGCAGCRIHRRVGATGLTPARGAAPWGLAVSGRSPGPPCCSTGAGQGRSPARHSAATPAGQARARVSSTRGRRGRGGWRRRGLGAGGPRAPRVPGGRANRRPAFGKIAIYGHVLGPRAPPPVRAARSRLNSGGGGRGRSHTPPPVCPARLSAAPSLRHSLVSGPRPSRSQPGPVPLRGPLDPRDALPRLHGAQGAGGRWTGRGPHPRLRLRLPLGAGRGPPQCAAPRRRGRTGGPPVADGYAAPGAGWVAGRERRPSRAGSRSAGRAALTPWRLRADRHGRRNRRARH